MPFWKMASATCLCSANRSDCLYSSSQPRSSQRNPSKMELSETSVFRPTSVSSMRRIIVPPLWRAYNQLKIKVLALPMWRYPVGDGAKRTLSMGTFRITLWSFMAEIMTEEPRLRGPIEGVDPLTAPVLYAFTQAREDLERYTEGLTTDEIWKRGVGFHIRHI